MQIEEAVLEFEGRRAVLFGYAEDEFFKNISDHLQWNVVVLEELRKLPQGAVFCDVGANIGTSALSACYIVPDCRVISFEPSPRALACLHRMIAENGLKGVEVVEAAVGAAPGELPLAETEFLAGSHLSVVKHAMRSQPTALVPVVTLDDVLLDQKRLDRLDLLKIDVEGFELDVLDGAMRVIDRFKPRMVIEYSAFGIVVNADGSPLRLVERLLEMAGEMNVMMPWGAAHVTPDAASIKHFIFGNMRVGAQDVAISVRPDYRASSPG